MKNDEILNETINDYALRYKKYVEDAGLEGGQLEMILILHLASTAALMSRNVGVDRCNAILEKSVEVSKNFMYDFGLVRGGENERD